MRKITTPRCYKNGLPGWKSQFGDGAASSQDKSTPRSKTRPKFWWQIQVPDLLFVADQDPSSGGRFKYWAVSTLRCKRQVLVADSSTRPCHRWCSRPKFWWLTQVQGRPFFRCDLKGKRRGTSARFYLDFKTLISVDSEVPRRGNFCPILLRL